MRTKSKDKALDKAIEKLYYVHATGRQIDIMKIGTFYAFVRQEIAGGAAIELAVIEGVKRFTEPS